MPRRAGAVEVLSNRIPSTRKRFLALAERAPRAGAEAARVEAKSRCPVSPHDKDHLIETVRIESRRTKTIREHSLLAGDPSTDAAPPAAVEFGTGAYYRRPGGEEVLDANALPAAGRRTPWVYYDAATDSYFTTIGNRPQPFMGPAAEVGREAMLRAAEGGV